MTGGIYGYAGAGLLAIGIVGGAYLKGDSAGANRVLHREQANELRLIAASQELRLSAERRIGQLETAAAQRDNTRQETVREIYSAIPTIVSRPVFRNICVDRDGVLLLDRAQAAANGTGGPPGTSSGPTAGTPPHPPQR